MGKTLTTKVLVSLVLYCLFFGKGVFAVEEELQGLLEIPDESTPLTPDEYLLLAQIEEALLRSSDLDNLRLGKQSLISGKLDLAKFFLNRVGNENMAVRMVRDRYRAMIAFIEDDLNETHRILSHRDFDQNHLYPHICLMRVLALLSKEANFELASEIARCTQATASFTTNNHFWLENIERLKFNRQRELRGTYLSDINFLVTSNEIVRIWLKTGLYFNQEDLILRHLATMPQSLYSSERARELLGMFYYRLGDHKMALEFTEGIESPNVENIRGNIALSEQKDELAFGHYKLALMLKENSLNAIERALPLAWKLEQWNDAHDLLNKLVKPGLDQRMPQSLRTAVLIRQEKFDYAQEYLNFLHRAYNQNFPLELELMQMVTALRTGQRELVERSSERACIRFDGLACWVAQANFLWSNIGRTLERQDNTYRQDRWDLGALKRPMTVEGLDEIPIVDQRDVMELDSEGVSIIPGIL
jgi:hypothetical protein